MTELIGYIRKINKSCHCSDKAIIQKLAAHAMVVQTAILEYEHDVPRMFERFTGEADLAAKKTGA